MNELEASFERISAVLDAERIPWAVVGGLAVSVRSEPRFTRDIDLAVAVADDQSAEAITRALTGHGYTVFKYVDQADTGRLALVRFNDNESPGARVVVDLLFASSGIEPEIARDAEPIEVFPNLVMPVARTGHLIAVKLLARDDDTRPQDRADLLALRAAASEADLADAEAAAALIEARGFHRGRPLQAMLRELVGQ